jgi:predicted alpha/beta superfamily hydrolase
MEQITFPNTEFFTTESVKTGKSYRISVALPEHYHESVNKNYPVVYVTDANICMGICINSSRLLALTYEIPELILVGIDNPVDTLTESTLLRNRDLTITPSEEINQLMKRVFGEDNQVSTGGGTAFVNFLNEELMPYIDSNYHTEEENRTFFGTSLGGLLGTYILFNCPGMFQNYIIGSPSYWYDDSVIFDFEEKYASTHQDLDLNVFFGVGALEETEGDQYGKKRAMVSNMIAMKNKLLKRKYPNLKVFQKVFQEETHYSVIGNIFSHGLKSLLEKPPAPEWA